MKLPRDPKERTYWLRYALCGALIGAGAILPGVSGGVLAVIFDIYRPMMEVLTHPKTALPKYWSLFPPLGIGWCIGFFLVAQGISAALSLSSAVTTWLFIGLIFGTVPSLFREAGREGRSPAAWTSLVLCALSLFAGLYYVSIVLNVSVTPNYGWYGFCGVLWGMGVIIPGMTSSSVMMALGLYQPMMDCMARLDVLPLATALLGMGLTILLLARLVNWFLEHYYSVAFHGILGIVLASTLVIIPTEYTGPGEIILSALCALGGYWLASLLDRLDPKRSP